MSRATGYILPLTSQRLHTLREHQSISDTFAEPVEEFEHSRSVPLVCFVNDQDGRTHYIASGRRGLAAGTGLRRLNLRDLKSISGCVYLSEFVNEIPPAARWRLTPKVHGGGLLTHKQFQALVDVILSRDSQLGELLRLYSSQREQRIQSLSRRAKEQLAFQKEAVATAMGIAGLSRAKLQAWEPPGEGAPTSFLDGLDQIRLREDQMIVHDMTSIPGYSRIANVIHGAALFEGEDGTKLTVILANRLPLEELTGADLIYYNERFSSFVLVQYKAMENDAGERPIFRLPNRQLTDEIARMDEMVSSLRECQEPTNHRGYRLDDQPFFLKLCSRIVFNPDDVSLVPGMYIPLGQWKLLENDSALKGKRGGRGVTFDNIERHIDNTHFMQLVSQAWVGTTPAQSKIIEEVIRNTVESGRAVVLAVKNESAAAHIE